MKRLSLLSESKTESLYHLQAVPTETYVLNYVLASTIGKFKARREQKNRTPKSAKKSVNTKKNRESYDSRFLPISLYFDTPCFRHQDTAKFYGATPSKVVFKVFFAFCSFIKNYQFHSLPIHYSSRVRVKIRP